MKKISSDWLAELNEGKGNLFSFIYIHILSLFLPSVLSLTHAHPSLPTYLHLFMYFLALASEVLVLVSKYYLSLKELGLLEELSCSRAWVVRDYKL